MATDKSDDRTRIEVHVDDERWDRVDDLQRSGPDDRHFTATTGESAVIVRFGDGIHGRRPTVALDTIEARYGAGTGRRPSFIGVRLQQGRVLLDTDWSEDVRGERLWGIYRAVVVNDLDPLLRKRLQVQIPLVSGTTPIWAEASLPGPDIEGPKIADQVWVEFEAGDPDRPVWVGRRWGG